jgi:hypothetical protein
MLSTVLYHIRQIVQDNASYTRPAECNVNVKAANPNID